MQIRQARRERLEEKERIENGRKVDDVLGGDVTGGRGKDDDFKDVLERIGGVKCESWHQASEK
jgi:hypothetical protein